LHQVSAYLSEVSSAQSRFFFFSSRRRHTRFSRDWSSDVCSSDLSNFKVCRTGQNNQEIELCFFWDENKYRDLKIGDKIIKIDNRSEERRVGKQCNDSYLS